MRACCWRRPWEKAHRVQACRFSYPRRALAEEELHATIQ